MIVHNPENSIRNPRPFCHPLFCHSSVVKCASSLLKAASHRIGNGLRTDLRPTSVFPHAARQPRQSGLKNNFNKPEARRNRENSSGYVQRSLCQDCRWPQARS